MKTALTIAGFDPSGWAGLQADLSTFRAFDIRGLSAATALTVQTLRGVTALVPVKEGLLKKQLEALTREYRIAAVKIGMLATKRNLETAVRIIKKTGLKNVVLDPVMRSTGGYPLLEKKAIAALKCFLPLVTVVTPNIPEAETLSGIKIKNTADMEKAAKAIHSLGAPHVLIKGGHLKGAPVDILFDGKKFYYYRGKRLTGKKEKFHGTGCLLSSAVASGLAKGKSVEKAVKSAKKYVTSVLAARQ